MLLNDFVVVGHALPQLPKQRTIVAGTPQGCTMVAVGPGTGLGVVLSHGNDVLPCEAGAADFAPRIHIVVRATTTIYDFALHLHDLYAMRRLI